MSETISSKRMPTKYPGVYYRVVKRKGKSGTERVFYVTYWQGDRKREVKAGRQFADDMTEAKAAGIRAKLVEQEIKPRQDVRREEAARPTVSRLWTVYNEAHTGTKEATNNRYLMKFLICFMNKIPSEITTQQLEDLRDRLLADGKSPQTARHVLSLLQRVIRFGAKRDLCELPTRLFFPMPQLDNKKTECLTPDQIRRLLDALDQDYDFLLAGMMRLALFTGMRKSALLALQWADLDLERGLITLRGDSAKSGKTTVIPMSAAARQVVENLPRTGSAFLFPNKKGGQRHSVQRFLARISKAADLPQGFRPLHGLRHTFASFLASSGKVDLYTLQRLLTHETPAMTARYAHLTDEALRRGAEAAGDILSLEMKKCDE